MTQKYPRCYRVPKTGDVRIEYNPNRYMYVRPEGLRPLADCLHDLADHLEQIGITHTGE